MAQPTLWERIKEWIAGIAWDVFLWGSNMTEAEYLAAIYEEAAREYKSEKANSWMMK
jgi:hypothetical protein